MNDPALDRHPSSGLGLAFLLIAFPVRIARGNGIHRLHQRFPPLDKCSIGARGRASSPWSEVTLVDRSRRKKSRWLESIPLVGASLIRAAFKTGDYPAAFTAAGRCARILLEYLDHSSTSQAGTS